MKVHAQFVGLSEPQIIDGHAVMSPVFVFENIDSEKISELLLNLDDFNRVWFEVCDDEK